MWNTRRLSFSFVVMLSTLLWGNIVVQGTGRSNRSNTVVTGRKPTAKTSVDVKNKSSLSKSNAAIVKTNVSTQASASLRRIKKEYMDAIEMGIAYDWVNQKPITRKKKKKKKTDSTNDDTNNHDNDAKKFVCLGPLTTNLRHWHFTIRGTGEIYSQGIYHGRILLPKNYPLSPPRVQMWTPSGRFQPGGDICLSASAYHPESWTPQLSIFSLVSALRFHMLLSPDEVGGIQTTLEQKEEFARNSLSWKQKWSEGNNGQVLITFDHAKLLEQGLLNSDNADDGSLDVVNSPPEQDDDKLYRTDEDMTGKDLEAEATGTGKDIDATITTPKPKKSKKKKKKKRVDIAIPVRDQAMKHQGYDVVEKSLKNRAAMLSITKILTSPLACLTIILLWWLYRS